MACGLACLLVSPLVCADVATVRLRPASIRDLGDGSFAIAFDHSQYPRDAKVLGARLRMRVQAGPGPIEEPILIQPIIAAPEGGGIRTEERPLSLLAPRFRSFDASDAVRRWISGALPNQGLRIRATPGWDRARTFLDIAREGTPPNPPPAVKGLAAFVRAGQVYLTWKEVECPFAGETDVKWKDLKAWKEKAAAGETPEITYTIVRHTVPITRTTLAEAERLDEIPQLSALDERMIETEWRGEQVKNVRLDDARVPRVVVEPEKEIPLGTGVYVRTSDRAGRFYYAVVTAIDGVENTVDLAPGNSLAEPLAEEVVFAEPVLHHVVEAQYFKPWPEKRFILWTDPPLSQVPDYIHLTVFDPPKRDGVRLPLSVNAFWWTEGWGPGATAWRAPGDVVHLHMETPWVLHKGIHEGSGTYKAFAQGKVQDYWVRQFRSLIPWLARDYRIDTDRIYVLSSDWAWHHGDLIAVVHENLTTDPKRSPVAIDSDRFWGSASRPAETEWGISAWSYYDIAWYVREHPEMELPFIFYTPNMHEGDFGTIDKPRFYRAMLDTKRAWMASWEAPVDEAWLYEIRRGDTLAAFSDCSLDSCPGIGMGDGDPQGQINGYLRFDPRTAIDRDGRWEMTVWLHAGDERGRFAAPADRCTVDITPRRCQSFRARPGESFRWTNALLGADPNAAPEVIQAGECGADPNGLVTCPTVVITKARHRIVTERR